MAHSQSRTGAMAPFDVKHGHGKRPGNPTTPTVEELLQGNSINHNVTSIVQEQVNDSVFPRRLELEYDRQRE